MPGPAHPVMGRPTLVVSQVHGGMNINSVPERTEIGVDVRTVPGQDLDQLRSRLQATLGNDVAIEPIVEVPGIFTGADNDWIQSVFAAAQEIAGVAPAIRVAPYFTDGSVLRPTEYCTASRLTEAVALYERLIDDWILAPR